MSKLCSVSLRSVGLIMVLFCCNICELAGKLLNIFYLDALLSGFTFLSFFRELRSLDRFTLFRFITLLGLSGN
jgi:hypothetical protein